jgi:hypothetical protein
VSLAAPEAANTRASTAETIQTATDMAIIPSGGVFGQ